MNEFLEVLGIFGCGVLGTSFIMFLKMQEICNANDLLNFRQVMMLYFKKCWATYAASLIMIVLYAVTHEDWIKIFTKKPDAHSVVTEYIGFVMIIGAAVGAAVQLGVQYIVLRRLDRILKTWGVDKNGKLYNPNKEEEDQEDKPKKKKSPPPAWVFMKNKKGN
jgi:hypothetical protein